MTQRTALLPCLLTLFCLQVSSGNLEKRLTSSRIDRAPIIDGIIDDIYSQFTRQQDFYQYEPQSGPPGSEKTSLLIAHDEENLYVAFRCQDDSRAVYARLGKREDTDNCDEVMLYLDTFSTRQRAFFFGATPYGVQIDGTRDDESRHHRKDFSWDGLWYSAGKLYDWGYFVEMKIPFSTIRFPADRDIQEWGMVAVRRIARKGEAILTVKMDRSIRGFLTQASTLVLKGPLKNGKKLELIPTTVMSQQQESGFSAAPGISLKYSFNSSFVANLALNPDFSQIESDAGQIDINQRYALEYPEKRPFFLESKSLYETPLSLFYSRRIADPDWGIKFSGQFGRMGIGFLSAYDRASFENLDEVAQGGEQSAWANIFRTRYDIGDARQIGFFISSKNYDGRSNLVLSADSSYKLHNLALRLQGAWSRGNQQQGSALDGSLGYETRSLNFTLGYKQISPDFDAQLGFIRRNSYRTYFFFGGCTFYPEKEYLRSFGIRGMFTQNFDWGDGHMTETQGSLSLHLNSVKNAYLDFGLRKEKEEYAGFMYDKLRWNLHLGIPLSRQVRIGGSMQSGDGINYDESDPYLGQSRGYGFRMDVSSFGCMFTEFDFTGYTFHQDQVSEPALSMNIFRLSNTYLFSRWMASRLIYEYNSYYLRTQMSLLMSYEINPGTGIHLGSSLTRYRVENVDLQNNWMVFLKLSFMLLV